MRKVRKGGTAIEYELKTSVRKTIGIRVNARRVLVGAPQGMPLKDIDAFVLSRFDWIMQALDASRAIEQKAQERAEEGFSEGAPIPLEGRNHTLRLVRAARKTVRTEGTSLIVSGPDQSTETVREQVRRYLIDRAMERLSERVKHFGAIMEKSPGRITIREQKTRWGSCSSLGNLNFNWKLIMAPPEALDYVVIHELCHMIEMNHSPAFWAQVERRMPDYKKWRDYLKKGIQSPFG